jgi:hypothetical protein
MSTNTKKSNKKTSPKRTSATAARKSPRRSVKKKTRSAALTVNTDYARVALVLLALNVLFTGYVVTKLTSLVAPMNLP